MSKRKIDELHGEDESGGGRGSVSVAESAVSLQSAGGWNDDLPPELIRRVAKLQNDARSLAGMERTCKLWRNVVMEGDDALKTADNGNSCLWRNLALAEHPGLESIAEIMTDDDNDGGGPTKFSWKGLLRSRQRAPKSSEKKAAPVYQPRTKLNDYIFVTSGRGDSETPSLWNQQVVSNGPGRRSATCKGALDPELVARLGAENGSDDLFGEDNLYSIEARIIVTRTSMT